MTQYFDTILKYNGTTETWSQVGTLQDTRGCIQPGQKNGGMYLKLILVTGIKLYTVTQCNCYNV